MKEFTVSINESSKRLDKFIKTVLPKAPDSFVYKMLRKKNIKLNGQKASGSEKLNEGDVVTLFLSDDTFTNFGYDDIDTNEYQKAYETLKNIKVVYEDDNILIVNKPTNVLSQKANIDDVSVNEWLIGYLLENSKVSSESLKSFKPSVLNRLDRNTNGLLMCAKTLNTAQEISLLLKDKRIRKFYKTEVLGHIDEEMLLEGYLIKNEADNTVKVYKNKPPEQKSSYIKTRVIPITKKDDTTVAEIELFTGKSHQIRAHLSSIGHPVIGDSKYGDQNANKKHNAKTQRLTAIRLIFPDDIKIDSLKGKTIELK